MEGTVSTICDLACLLACPSRRLGVNNVFVAVTGVERKDTVGEIVPNTWKSQQCEQIDMSSKCCCQTSKMQDKSEPFFSLPKASTEGGAVYVLMAFSSQSVCKYFVVVGHIMNPQVFFCFGLDTKDFHI